MASYNTDVKQHSYNTGYKNGYSVLKNYNTKYIS
jgi:hypothetical protein